MTRELLFSEGKTALLVRRETGIDFVQVAGISSYFKLHGTACSHLCTCRHAGFVGNFCGSRCFCCTWSCGFGSGEMISRWHGHHAPGVVHLPSLKLAASLPLKINEKFQSEMLLLGGGGNL